MREPVVLLYAIVFFVIQLPIRMQAQESDTVQSSGNVEGATKGATDVSARLWNTENRRIISAKASGYAGKSAECDNLGHIAETKDEDENTESFASFSLTLSGEIENLQGERGKRETYFATRTKRGNIYIRANESNSPNITVPHGETVSFYLKESLNDSPVDGDWKVSLNGSSAQEKSGVPSITFNRTFWGNIVSWFTDDASISTPKPGIYSISATRENQTAPKANGELTIIGIYSIEGNGESAISSEVSDGDDEVQTLYVPAGKPFTIKANRDPEESNEWPAGNPTFKVNLQSISTASAGSGTVTTNDSVVINSKIFNLTWNDNKDAVTFEQLKNEVYTADYHGTFTVTAQCGTSEKSIRIVVCGVDLDFVNPIAPAPNGEYDTLLVSNIADESTDAKCPDYANFGERTRETSLLELNMTVSCDELVVEKFKLKFEYNGAAQLDNLERAEIPDSELKAIFMRNNKKFYDYTPFKTGLIRVWASSKQTQNAIGWSSEKIINATSARDKRKFGQGTGNYFAPANTSENAYPISDLFPESDRTTCNMTLWVEGINPSENTQIKATLLYDNNGTWQELASSSVNIKVLEARVILNTDNDKNYILDDKDHKIKDQHDGFQGWFADNFNSSTLKDATSTHGFENLFPISLKNLPPLPSNNMKYELKVENGVIARNPKNNQAAGEGILRYLKNAACANLLRTTILTAQPSYDILEQTETSDKEFLFGIYRQNGNEEEKKRILLVLYPDKAVNSYIVLDSSSYTFRPVDKYFWMGTCRHKEDSATTYKNDPGKSDSATRQYGNVAPCSGWSAIDSSTMIDQNKQYFVYLHGFHSDDDQAITSNKIVFRRLYWLGYRGNYAGVTWEGNERIIDFYNYFDGNMENALLSGRAVKNFLSSLGNNPMKRHIAAHSLGNLVMWEAFRQHVVNAQNSRLVNSAISIQAAVWEETFWSQTPLTYQKQEYDTMGIPNPETVTDCYNVDRLINNSWVFWFNQGINGMYAAKNAALKTINSRTGTDEYLDGGTFVSMKGNDFYSLKDYYDRMEQSHRTHSTLPDKAAMFRPGEIVRKGLFGMTIPKSAFTDPLGIVDSTYFSDRIRADVNYGWIDGDHFQHTDAAFYNIYKWYSAAFKYLKQGEGQ